MSDFSDKINQVPAAEDEQKQRHAHLLESALPSRPAKQGGSFTNIKTISDLDELANASKGVEEIVLREKALHVAESDPTPKDLSLAVRHTYLAERYALLENDRLSNEYFKKANPYWQSILAKESIDGEIAFRTGNIPAAIEHYESTIENLDREINAIWPRQSAQPTFNPVSSGLSKRLADLIATKRPESMDEAFQYFRLAATNLGEYNRRYGSAVEPEELELTAAALKAKCILTNRVPLADNGRAEKTYKENLFEANDLFETLAWMEKNVKPSPVSGKDDNYGNYDPSLIPIFTKIADFQTDQKANQQYEVPQTDGTPGWIYAHRMAINALERVYLMQTKHKMPAHERLTTLHNLAGQYFAVSDLKGLDTYLTAARITAENKDSVPSLGPPANCLSYLQDLWQQRQPPNPMPPQKSAADEVMGKRLLEFSATFKELADRQASVKMSNNAIDNYIVAMATLSASFSFADKKTLDSAALLDRLNIIKIVPETALAIEKESAVKDPITAPVLNAADFTTGTKYREMREQAANLYHKAYTFAEKNYGTEDPNSALLLAKAIDFYTKNHRPGLQIKVLTIALDVAKHQLENADKSTNLNKVIDLYKSIAKLQIESFPSLQAVQTSRDALQWIRKFHDNKAHPDTLEALHMFSHYCQKNAQQYYSPVLRELKTFSIEQAANAKREEIEMAKELKIDQKNIEQLLLEEKAIRSVQ